MKMKKPPPNNHQELNFWSTSDLSQWQRGQQAKFPAGIKNLLTNFFGINIYNNNNMNNNNKDDDNNNVNTTYFGQKKVCGTKIFFWILN